MSNSSKNANIRSTLDGINADLFEDWDKIGFQASFGDRVQPKLSLNTDTVKFVNKSAIRIRQWILDGYIFEGMPYNLDTFNNTTSRPLFEGVLDLANSYRDFTPHPSVECKLKLLDGQDSLQQRLEGITWELLEQKGFVSLSDYTDINYQVIKITTFIEILVSAVTLYLLIKELQESIRTTAKAIAEVSAEVGGGVTGSIAGFIYAIALAVIQLAYLLIMVVAIINLVNTLLNTILPPLRVGKGIKWRRAFEIVADYLGYTFDSSIDELDNLYYLPSNINFDILDPKKGIIKKLRGTTKGIPNANEYGYLLSNFFELAETTFTAEKAILNGVLHLRSQNDPFWVKQSNWVAPSHIPPTTEYNTSELNADVVNTFLTDFKDSWTIDKWPGTNYEIITEAITVKNPKASSLKGQRTFTANSALGNVKVQLTALERIIFNLANFTDKVTGAIGKGTNLAKKVSKKTNVLKVSQNDYSVSKLIYLDGAGKIPTNHRDLFSAKAMWEKYGNWNSFVANNFNGQKFIYNGVRLPFGFEDFCKLKDNGYFKLQSGEVAKATELLWIIGEDMAEISYYVRKPYTTNLKERKIEPDGS